MKSILLNATALVFMCCFFVPAKAIADTSDITLKQIPFAEPNLIGLNAGVRVFPQSPWPIFYEDRGIGMVVDENGKFISSKTFPFHAGSDVFVITPSGEILGSPRIHDQKLYAEDTATGNFHVVAENFTSPSSVIDQMSWVGILNGILISDQKGGLNLYKDYKLQSFPLPLKSTDNQYPIYVTAIFDLPKHKAAAIGTNDGRLAILDGLGHLNFVPGINIRTNGFIHRSEDFTEIKEYGDDYIYASCFSSDNVIYLRQDKDGVIPEEAITIPPQSQPIGKIKAREYLRYHPTIDKYVVYASPSGLLTSILDDKARFYELEKNELKEIKGLENESFGVAPLIYDVLSRHSIIITGKDALFIYDGHNPAQKIIYPNRDMDISPWVQEVEGLQKILLNFRTSLFELTLDNKLVSIPIPSELSGVEFDPAIGDMPQSHAAILFGSSGVFALDKDNHFTHVHNDQKVNYDTPGHWYNFTRSVPASNQVLFERGADVYMVYEENKK